MTLARFDHDGKYVYAGTSQGYILIFHSRTKAVGTPCFKFCHDGSLLIIPPDNQAYKDCK